METLDKDFVALVSNHQKLIHKVCNVYCYTTDDRKDLFQDIVLQLWRSYPSYKGQASLSTWMYRVALNTAITQQRKKKTQLVPLEQVAIQGSMDDDDQQHDHSLLTALINELDKIEKSLILLYLEQKSYEEIADIMGLSKTNVSVKLVRIKKKLAKKFKQYQDE